MAGTMTTTVGGGRSIGAAAVFVLTSALVSALVGAGLSLLGTVVPPWVPLAALVLTCCVYIAFFVKDARTPFPPWPGQIPARWIDRRRPYLTAVRYAAVWGTAFSTPVRAGALIALALVAIAEGAVIFGAAAFALVGLVKAAPTFMTAVNAPSDPSLGGWRMSAWPRAFVVVMDALVLTVLATLVLRSFIV